MNVLTITAYGKGFVLELNSQRLIILNQKGLVWHLKKQVGLDASARKSVLLVLDADRFVAVNLDHVGAA